MTGCDCLNLWRSTLLEVGAALPLAPGSPPRVLLRTEGVGARVGRSGPDIAAHNCPFCGHRYPQTERWGPVLVNTHGEVMR